MKGLLHDIRKLVSRVNGKYFEVKAKQELSQSPSLTSVTKPQESPFKNNFHWGNPGTDNGSPRLFTSFPSMNVKIDPKGIASQRQSGMMGGWPAIKPPATDTAAPTSKNGEEDEESPSECNGRKRQKIQNCDEDPPKHEFTPVVEDDVVYSKSAKLTKPQESPFKNNFHWGNPGTDNGSPPVFTSFPSMNVKIDPKGIASQSGMMGGWPAIKPPATDTAAPTSKNGEEDEDEEPPKHEFTPVVEDDAVYSKRCKLFEKREGSFKERGIGVLYINELKTGKYQIVIRADNTLGTVLMNTHLNSAIPVQKSGKNNVLTVDPTGDGGKAISVLIRVKTGEDADELIEKLNEFKNVRLKT